ncbi:hypothetical protein AAMO2058_001081000 [Amorphochlora amoebiformis]
MPRLALFASLSLIPIVFGDSDVWSNPCDLARWKGAKFCDVKLDLDTRSADLVAKISDDDKAGLLTNSAFAAPSVNLSSYQWWSEALHGVGQSPGVSFKDQCPFATIYPQVQTTSQSWNKTLFAALGTAIATEGRAMANLGHAGLTFWAPNINVYRDPRWGRGQETPGEDPHMNGVYAEEFVKHFQFGPEDPTRLRASSCCKHFEAYSFENAHGITRHNQNAILDVKDTMDTYRPAFEQCVVKGQASGIMCSYNSVNGVPSCASEDLLNGLLRTDWKFDGYITSDCGAVEDVYDQHNYTHTIAETFNATFSAGMDSDCGDFASPDAVKKAVAKGVFKMETIDKALRNLVRVQMRLGMFDPEDEQPFKKLGLESINTKEHQELSIDAARQGVVLLKNDNSSLPFAKKQGLKIAVIGPNANATEVLQGNYIGVPPFIVSPLMGLSKYGTVTYKPGCKDGPRCENRIGFLNALVAVENADIAVLVMGLNQSIETEANDRTSIALPEGQVDLILKAGDVAAQSGTKLVLVLVAGGSCDLSFAKENPNIKSILWVGYNGQSGGDALAQAIFGEFSPSGKLTQTIYFANYTKQVSILDMRMRPDKDFPGRGYRYFKGPVVYPFAYGLSYTSFAYKFTTHPPELLSRADIAKGLKQGHGLRSTSPTIFTFKVKITNTGGRDGSEVIVGMLSPPNAGHSGAPIKTLVDFDKIFLRAGESGEVELRVTAHQFALSNQDGEYMPELGGWTLQVGDLKAISWVL